MNEVAGDEVFGGDGLFLSVAGDGGLGGEHSGEGSQRLFGFSFLEKADEGVEDDHGENDPGVDPVIQQGGDHGGGEQDVNEDVVELQQEAAKGSDPVLDGQGVGSVLFAEGDGLLVGQALFGIDLKMFKNIFGGFRMPCGGFGWVHEGDFGECK